MLKKTALFTSLAASVLAFATLSYAAPATPVQEPAPAVQQAVKVDMAGAIEAAQAKFPGSKAISASLHPTRGYGLVWDVRLTGEDGNAVRVFVNPEDASVIASNSIGIRGMGPGYGYGPGYGQGLGMGPGAGYPDCPRAGGPGMGNPDCPYWDDRAPRHHGGWWHGGRHGRGCGWF